MYVHDLRDADASCGGKAVGLAKLIAAGLPVPDGFVIDGGAFRAIVGDLPTDLAGVGHALEDAAKKIASAELPELRAEVERRAAALGTLLVVRSSATIEDGAAGAAAGVFSSRREVHAADVWHAVLQVWLSALTPLAVAYARRRGGTTAIGVIVQRFVEGERVTIYSRPPGHADANEMLVQRGEQLARVPRDERAEIVERAIGADADIEMVGDAIVQARPIVHPQPKRLAPAPPAVLAPLEDGRVWTWDIAHNPDPLSTAQQGLVERVAEIGPYSLRVCAGFLYYAPREAVTPPPIERAAEIEARLDRVLADPATDVDDAIRRYVEFYAIWSRELAPLIASATKQGGHRPSSIEARLLAAARREITEDDVIAQLGTLAPAWDVAVPTFGEQPALIRDAIARATIAASSTSTSTSTIDHGADLAERDDFLFARAQNLVRRALLARARELDLADESDIFWLPLDVVPADPDDAHRRARAARAAAGRAAGAAGPSAARRRHRPTRHRPRGAFCLDGERDRRRCG